MYIQFDALCGGLVEWGYGRYRTLARGREDPPHCDYPGSMYRLLLFAVCVSCPAQVALRMNQIQVVGTHNSYHAGLAPGEMAVLRKQNPQAADSLAYKHPKIEAQLDAGVRQLELDVYGDAKGGLFA